MSTSYDVPANGFLRKISDYLLMNMESAEVIELVDGYILGALPYFKQCSKLSVRDDVARTFDDDLTNEEVEILANLMVLEWLKPIVYNVDELRNKFSTKDYKIFSPADLIGKLTNLQSYTRKENSRLIVSYTYTTISLDNLVQRTYTHG